YDSARLVMQAIETAAKAKGGMPTRDEVITALRGLHFQGIAYARPVAWDAKGDNTAAVIFLNVVEGDHFKEIGEVSRDDLPRHPSARWARPPVRRRAVPKPRSANVPPEASVQFDRRDVMERTREQIADRPILAPHKARRLQAGLLLLAGVLALGGCVVVPAQPAYVAPAPVYVAPAPVYVAPGPVYYGRGYYGWHR